jgi:hypothetical protein
VIGCSCIYVLRFSVFGMIYVFLESFCILCLNLYQFIAVMKDELSNRGKESESLVPRRNVNHKNYVRRQTRLKFIT